jgi:SAM-dependent methyltransferase
VGDPVAGRSEPVLDARPAGRCPICAGASLPLDRFTFADKPPLARDVTFESCASCNFIFAVDIVASVYSAYYAAVQNDGAHIIVSDAPDSIDHLQGSHLSQILSPDFAGRVLDFGCGQGRLLRWLESRYPRATLCGCDVANFLPADSAIRYVPTIDGLDERFDVIVMSHVAEHLVEFSVLAQLEKLLASDGLLYVEVPDPFAYAAHPRREFMYYFDRLHVNHFGDAAMRRLLCRFGFAVHHCGSHRFPYRDGHYPAHYVMASRSDDADRCSADANEQRARETLLADVYRAYRDSEGERARRWRHDHHTAFADGVLVYGAGDNFRRACWFDGPLHGVRINAVIDQRAATMEAEDGLSFESMPGALQRFPAIPVVITVSQGSETVAATIRSASPARPVFFV